MRATPDSAQGYELREARCIHLNNSTWQRKDTEPQQGLIVLIVAASAHSDQEIGDRPHLPVSGCLITETWSDPISISINKARLPTICEAAEYAAAGGLLSYSSSDTDGFRRAAVFVDKILKGARPAELPVEQPMSFDLVVNMKTAKALGITVPQIILVRADRLIE